VLQNGSNRRDAAQGVLLTVYKINNFGINSEYEKAREPNPLR
jgi:hypothetical protein